jgi:ATP dependent DNA ligase domain
VSYGAGADQSQPRFEPCLPRLAKQPPAGSGWIHEIKHDGFRIIAQREADSVRLITRNGHDFSGRFPLILAAVAALPARSCVVDGEAIACDEKGLSVFEMILNGGSTTTPSLSALLTCLSSMARICGASRTRFAKLLSKGYCAALNPASHSTAISKSTAQSSTNWPARSAARALCRSALDRLTGQAAAIVGSRSRTRRRQR